MDSDCVALSVNACAKLCVAVVSLFIAEVQPQIRVAKNQNRRFRHKGM